MTRPAFAQEIPAGSFCLWSEVAVHFVIFGAFSLLAFVVCKNTVKKNFAIATLPFCLSLVAGLALLLSFGVSLMTVKGMILALLLLYASLSDLKTREVSDSVSIMLFILAFVGFEMSSLPSMLMGTMAVFIPQFVLAVINPSRAFGGADLKISTSLAFLLGVQKGIFALITGLLLAVIVMAIYNRVNAKSQKGAFPLVPFLSVGAMLAYII